MPMPAVVKATHTFGGPGDDMRDAGPHFLLTTRAPEGPGRASTADPANKPLAVGVGLSSLDPTDGPVQIELGGLTTSAMGSRHVPIVAGKGNGERNG